MRFKLLAILFQLSLAGLVKKQADLDEIKQFEPDSLPKRVFHETKKILRVDPKHFCIQGLVEGFGFEGQKFPVKTSLKMCPSVQLSCCKVKDQLFMYENWVLNREEKNLADRLKFYRQVYETALELMERIDKRAKRLYQILKNRPPSNCGILSKRLSQFPLGLIKEQLRSHIIRMEFFFKNAYGGVYCMFCDSNSHKYIDLVKRTFHLSQKFCRDIVTNTLPFLVYFDINLMNYLNLQSQFVLSCDFDGTFYQANVPTTIQFKVRNHQHKILSKCKKNRNQPFWLRACLPLCEKFNLFKFSDMFVPNLHKFVNWNLLIFEKLKYIEAREKKFELFNFSEKRKLESTQLDTDPSLNLVQEFSEMLQAPPSGPGKDEGAKATKKVAEKLSIDRAPQKKGRKLEDKGNEEKSRKERLKFLEFQRQWSINSLFGRYKQNVLVEKTNTASFLKKIKLLYHQFYIPIIFHSGSDTVIPFNLFKTFFRKPYIPFVHPLSFQA